MGARIPIAENDGVAHLHRHYAANLKDWNIFLPSTRILHEGSRYRRPNNLEEIQRELNQEVPMRLNHVDYEAWKRAVERCPNETSMIWPIFQFSGAADNQAVSIRFERIKTITGNHNRSTTPNLYDGIAWNDIDERIRERQLANGRENNTLFPSAAQLAPAAPNFFVHHNLTPANCVKLAAHNGAYGARAMQTLQFIANSGERTYDNNAYTFSVIFQRTSMSIWAHFARRPPAGDNLPDYLPYCVAEVNMMINRENFTRGARLFRNARRLAERFRMEFVEAANDRTRNPEQYIPGNTPESDDDDDDEEGSVGVDGIEGEVEEEDYEDSDVDMDLDSNDDGSEYRP